MKGEELDVQEIEDTRLAIWREIQKKHFSEEIVELKKSGRVQKKSVLLRWGPTLDTESQVMRAGG